MAIRVLLIDDLADDREMYGEGLRMLGFEVLLATREEAVEAARGGGPAVIVLHLTLNDRWDICEDLRRGCGEVPVIVLTAAVRPDGANRERARATVNCAAFVGKPCTVDDLAAVIDRVTRGERRIELSSGFRSHG